MAETMLHREQSRAGIIVGKNTASVHRNELKRTLQGNTRNFAYLDNHHYLPTNNAPTRCSHDQHAQVCNRIRIPRCRQKDRLHYETNHCLRGEWSKKERNLFLYGVQIYGFGAWKEIGTILLTRSNRQIKSHGQKLMQKICEGKNIFEDFDSRDVCASQERLFSNESGPKFLTENKFSEQASFQLFVPYNCDNNIVSNQQKWTCNHEVNSTGVVNDYICLPNFAHRSFGRNGYFSTLATPSGSKATFLQSQIIERLENTNREDTQLLNPMVQRNESNQSSYNHTDINRNERTHSEDVTAALILCQIRHFEAGMQR